MEIKQFYDKSLAHASYALLSAGQIAIIDPGRDPRPYYDFAKEHDAVIRWVIETHPHADFVSSHFQIHQEKGATILVSEKVGADYPHQSFDQGDSIDVGAVRLKAINTPGHSPDSICVLVLDESGKEHALFTGDTLFVGDVGRPDLRENAGNMKAQRESLARSMYQSIQEKLKPLADSILVYPAHGAGSLCGKNLSADTHSNMQREKETNWAFQVKDEGSFVREILSDQPFIPKYFGYDVDLNKEGVSPLANSLQKVKRIEAEDIPSGSLLIDTRHESFFKKGHLAGAINLMIKKDNKFETWLGAIIDPTEKFYLVCGDASQREVALYRAAKIGYENLIAGAAIATNEQGQTTSLVDLGDFLENPDHYTILDIRNASETKEGLKFTGAYTIPLHELRERADELPVDKPIMVHCAGGYRSAAGASIVQKQLGNRVPVFDLGEDIHKFN